MLSLTEFSFFVRYRYSRHDDATPTYPKDTSYSWKDLGNLRNRYYEKTIERRKCSRLDKRLTGTVIRLTQCCIELQYISTSTPFSIQFELRTLLLVQMLLEIPSKYCDFVIDFLCVTSASGGSANASKLFACFKLSSIYNESLLFPYVAQSNFNGTIQTSVCLDIFMLLVLQLAIVTALVLTLKSFQYSVSVLAPD